LIPLGGVLPLNLSQLVNSRHVMFKTAKNYILAVGMNALRKGFIIQIAKYHWNGLITAFSSSKLNVKTKFLVLTKNMLFSFDYYINFDKLLCNISVM
jgi:hypothetical protein